MADEPGNAAHTAYTQAGADRSGKRIRNPRVKLSNEAKMEIARLVNDERRRPKDVASEMSLPVNAVYHIAGMARSAKQYQQPQAATDTEPRKRYGQLPPKTNAPMPVSPFSPDDPCNLKGKTLSSVEKYYLACLVNIKRISCAAVALRYNLVGVTVKKYANEALTQSHPFQKVARPSSRLDGESDEVLRALASLEPRPSLNEFKTRLTEEFNKTRERKRGMDASFKEANQTADAVSVVAAAVGSVGGKTYVRPKDYKKYLSVYGYI